MSVDGNSLGAQLVEEYFNRKALNELGAKFEIEDLTDWEVEAFTLIHNQVAKTMNEEQKKEAKKIKRKGIR